MERNEESDDSQADRPAAGVAVIAAAGIGVGMVGRRGGARAAGPPRLGAGRPGYSWYRSMMGRYYGGSMMGGLASGWMMGREGLPVDDGRDQRARLDARRHAARLE